MRSCAVALSPCSGPNKTARSTPGLSWSRSAAWRKERSTVVGFAMRPILFPVTRSSSSSTRSSSPVRTASAMPPLSHRGRSPRRLTLPASVARLRPVLYNRKKISKRPNPNARRRAPASPRSALLTRELLHARRSRASRPRRLVDSLPRRYLQRPRHFEEPLQERLRPDRRPAQAPLRPDPQPRRDRQGLHEARAGDARSGHPGPQPGGHGGETGGVRRPATRAR